jgi:hypothetical protein
MTTRSILTCAVFLLALSLLGAQPTQSREFRLLALTSESITGIFYELKGEKVPVIAPVGAPSASYAMPAKQTLTFYKEIPAPPTASPGTKPIKQPIADISLSGTPPLLVLLRPAGPNAAVPYTGECLTFKRGAQPQNSGQFFNRTTRKTAVSYGPEQFILEPGESRVVTFDAPKKRGEVMDFKIGYSKPDGSWVLAENVQMYKEENGKQLILFLENPRFGSGESDFQVFYITDWYHPQPEPTP